MVQHEAGWLETVLLIRGPGAALILVTIRACESMSSCKPSSSGGICNAGVGKSRADRGSVREIKIKIDCCAVRKVRIFCQRVRDVETWGDN